VRVSLFSSHKNNRNPSKGQKTKQKGRHLGRWARPKEKEQSTIRFSLAGMRGGKPHRGGHFRERGERGGEGTEEFNINREGA